MPLKGQASNWFTKTATPPPNNAWTLQALQNNYANAQYKALTDAVSLAFAGGNGSSSGGGSGGGGLTAADINAQMQSKQGAYELSRDKAATDLKEAWARLNASRTNDNQDLLSQLHGVELGRDQATAQRGVQDRKWGSDATARGAYTAWGTQQGFGDIATQLQQAMAGYDQQTTDYRNRFAQSEADRQISEQSLRDQSGLQDRQNYLNLYDLNLTRDQMNAQLANRSSSTAAATPMRPTSPRPAAAAPAPKSSMSISIPRLW